MTHPRPRPVFLTWMLCPRCATSDHQLLNLQCPVCGGRGSLCLGGPALSVYDAETVSAAVRRALDSPEPVAEVLAGLYDGGLLTRPEDDPGL
ncbi:hypothetical protein NQ036_03490 [Brevibacterium sp. 91QC2O2]|uniref:hypothetical protein n=1 Tax=Brevibacterium sp. 91QC2O2 TaxID=2968458 RepID=UPI00211CD28E|nr:hypothetical protein [Brevibacterium sp. 91QC2O2]MCQ9367310.1 hypothetical protein [Brevibacterium sp. 91QC2O2]